MEIKKEITTFYLVDFCRKKDCQQIRIVDTNDNEIKSFFINLFKNKRYGEKSRRADKTLVKIRRVNCDNFRSERLLSMPIYNISPRQARIYTNENILIHLRNK